MLHNTYQEKYHCFCKRSKSVCVYVCLGVAVIYKFERPCVMSKTTGHVQWAMMG